MCINEFFKSKTGPALLNAFKVILTDQQTEFLNKHFQKLMNNENIHLYNTFSEMKGSVVEQLICMFKTKIWHYFTMMRYIDMFPGLVYVYNHSVHHNIKMKSALVNRV